jgi:hypothetical protein
MSETTSGADRSHIDPHVAGSAEGVTRLFIAGERRITLR